MIPDGTETNDTVPKITLVFCQEAQLRPKQGVWGVGGGAAEHGRFTQLRKQGLAFRETKAAERCRAEFQGRALRRKRTPEICLEVPLSLC